VLSGEIITMGDEKHSGPPPKSLADVLAEELDGKLGGEHTHKLSKDEKQGLLKAVYERIHKEQPTRSALCLSGGGIRSATFGLGILQGLAKHDLLHNFDYLSTVSGGGYVGGWLTAWIKNNPGGVKAVAEELKCRLECTLNPEPQEIRHLRAFGNYLTPKTGLMSADTWTLIATFVRNMFLNWLVLISWLAAALMIPRLYLASISVEPDWSEWIGFVPHRWDIGLTIVLAVGLALITIAMAYAIIDVPSTGNARLPQSRFLKFRELPLLLASLILAGWWAVFRNVHGSELFQPREWLLKFVAFSVAGYLSGGVLATVILSGFRKPEQKARPGRWTHSLLRLGTIVLTAAFAGVCLWAIATKRFLAPDVEFTLKRDCEATLIATQQQIAIPAGWFWGRTSFTDWSRNSFADNEFTLKRDCEATLLPTQEIPRQEEIKIQAGDQVCFEEKDRDALEPIFVPAPANHALNYVCFAPALFLAVLLLVNFLFTGLASRITGDEDREWWGRSAAWIVITMFSWIAFNMIALWGAQAITATTTGNRLQVFLGQPEVTGYFKAILGAFGGVTGIVAGLLALRHKLGQKRGFQWLLVIVTVVFFVLLSIVISWVIVLIRTGPWMQSAAKWFYHESALSSLSLPAWRVELFISLFLMSVLLFFGIVMGFFIDANKFSLHAIYRNRLIRAYLAASDKKRSPNKFTGFDPGDDFELCELKSEKPFHLINATLNVIKSKELAWQERKAESFTMSRLHCGSWHVGYRPSAEYGDGITLGTALAISGAAANPNMGYYSSPVVGFLMTLFNVRLGWWLGNPGPCGDKTWRRAGPGYAVGPLFSEAIGNTTDRSKYVNLSDGGHFENLGLYEMVLRRCKLILVVDAAQDSEYVFADLGNAIRKIRIDLGIPIDIRVVSPKKSKGTVNHCAFGTIKYSAMDGRGTDGSLIYVKPLVSGDEPPDVSNYTAAHPEFPHETTTDQWFSESQFESYRLLGEHAVETICGKDWKPKVLPLFFEQVRRDLAV
jgi:patatin-like phospholipase